MNTTRTATLDNFIIISTAHGLGCDACYSHAESSVTMAKVTGSVGGSGVDETRDPATGEIVQGHGASVLRADVEVMREAKSLAAQQEDWERYDAIRYSDFMLRASVAAGGYGVGTHPRQAAALLKLPTVALRLRAAAEAQTLTNLMGGIISGRLHEAAHALLANIEAGDEGRELYGERTAREYREREAELRKVTGNPNAIYYPHTR